jgi:hypothetical protein
MKMINKSIFILLSFFQIIVIISQENYNLEMCNSENNFKNQYNIYKKTKVDSMSIINDSLFVYINLKERCESNNLLNFDDFTVIAQSDTLKINYSLTKLEEEIFCSCNYKLVIKMKNDKPNCIILNERVISNHLSNYDNFDFIVERYESRKIKRIIYYENQSVIMEEYYNENNKIDYVKIYQNHFGILIRELKE